MHSCTYKKANILNMATYFNEKFNNELVFIKSAGYAEMASSVLLDTEAKLEIK